MNKTAAETRGSLNSGSVTHSSGDSGDNARTNSSDQTHSANINRRKIPNYLLASTGSCHDICKYGGRHAFEDELKKIPLRKRIAKPSLNEDTFIEILVAGEQKKENVYSIKRSLKPSPDAKAHPRRPNVPSSGKACSLNSPAEKPPPPEKSLPQDSIDDKVSSSDQKTIDHLLKHPSSVKSNSVKVKSSDVKAGGKVRASVSASANKSAAAPLVPKSSLSKTAPHKARQLGRVKSSPLGKDQHASNSHVSEKILHVIKTGTGSSTSESTPENNGVPALEPPSSPVFLSQVNPSMADEVNGTDEVATESKTLTMETENTILEPSPDSHATAALPPSSLKSSSHRRTPSASSSSSSKSSFHRRSPSSSSSKSSSHRRSPSSSSSSSKSSSHRRSPSSSSSSKSSSHSRSPSMSSLKVDEEIKHIGKETDKNVKTSKAQPPKVILNKNPRKIKEVSCDDKYIRPVKLKFRSGKILDPHQDNNNNISNTSRRLKFRRMQSDGNKAEISVSHSKRSLESGNIQENSKTLRKSRVAVSDYKRRSPMKLFGSEKGSSLQGGNNGPLRLRFRRGRVIGADEGKGDSKRSIRFEGGNVKMKLKHQDLKGKKDDQCLFNNVIEETASKLAESRKSKVLALVGAFETVISLHSPRA